MAHLEPPSQICLGLTSRYFHRVFHVIYGDGGGTFSIGRHPFDLRMQESVCGEYMRHWWWDHWSLLDTTGVEWERSLADLLRGERSLWADLRYCPGCWKYKPLEAFDWKCTYEKEALVRCRGNMASLGEDAAVLIREGCRRCRVKTILVELEGREEIVDKLVSNRWNDSVSGLSLGLRRLDVDQHEPFFDTEEITGDLVISERVYESWEDVLAARLWH